MKRIVIENKIKLSKRIFEFCQRNKLLFSLFLYSQMIVSTVHITKNDFRLNQKKTSFENDDFISLSTKKHTHTHTHTYIYTSRASLLNERKEAIHEIDLKRKIRIIRFSKIRNIVFNIDLSFKK